MRTFIIKIAPLVPGNPGFRRNEHGKMPRMQSLANRLFRDAIGHHGIEFDDAKLVPANIFVGVIKCRLVFRARAGGMRQ